MTQCRGYASRTLSCRPFDARPCVAQSRSLATVSEAPKGEGLGPLEEYDRRVELGLLRNDKHQRGMLLYNAMLVVSGGD